MESHPSRSSYHAHQAVPRGSRDGESVNMRRATVAHEAGNKCPNQEPKFGQHNNDCQNQSSTRITFNQIFHHK